MSYSVEALQTVAECDAMLTVATNQRLAQVGKQAQLQAVQANFQEDAVGIEEAIPAHETKVALMQTMVSALPAGTIKEEEEYSLRKVQNRLYVLKSRQVNHGTQALLKMERDLAATVHEIAESDALITAINARKSALGG